MDAKVETDAASKTHRTTVERTSDREAVVRRIFNAPARLVFEAWTKPELVQRWWAPKSYGLVFVSCEIDARTGGGYRFVFSHPSVEEPAAFFGRYIEVIAPHRLVWTNEEAGEEGQITTVTFEETDGVTLVVLHELYPSKEALDAAIESGAVSGFSDDMFDQLDDVLAAGAS